MSDTQNDVIPDDLTKLREGVYTSVSNPKNIWFATGEFLGSMNVDPDTAMVSTLVDKVITMFEADGLSVTVIADE